MNNLEPTYIPGNGAGVHIQLLNRQASKLVLCEQISQNGSG